MAEAVDELERNNAVSVDEAVQEIKQELGIINAEPVSDSSVMRSSNTKLVYSLGASHSSSRTDGSIAEVNRLNNEIEKLRQSLNEDALLASFGIIIINGNIPFKGKKPETPGKYFKTDKNGNISSYVIFDGNDYIETIECKKGKMYSYDGNVLYFDGTNCKPLGD